MTVDLIDHGEKLVRSLPLSRLPPAQPPRPARQEPHHCPRDRSLAFTPRDMFHHHSMLGAFHPPRGVPEMGGDSPQGHKQPIPLHQSIVARSRLLTLRAPPPHAAMRFQPDFDRARLSLLTLQSNLLVNKPSKVLYSVQNRLNL